jgi:hypothetical protein
MSSTPTSGSSCRTAPACSTLATAGRQASRVIPARGGLGSRFLRSYGGMYVYKFVHKCHGNRAEELSSSRAFFGRQCDTIGLYFAYAPYSDIWTGLRCPFLEPDGSRNEIGFSLIMAEQLSYQTNVSHNVFALVRW